MPLDYSQRRLISKALHTKKHSKQARRLRLYAFLTGLMSLMISGATLFLHIAKKI